MRILSLSNCPLKHVLGSGRTRLAWAQGLRDLGHEVTSVDSVELLGGDEGAAKGRRLRLAWKSWEWLQRSDLTKFDLIEFFGAEFWLPTWRLAARRERPLLIAHTDGLELLMEERLRPLRLAESQGANAVRRAVAEAVTALKDRLERLAFTRADGFVTASGADYQFMLRHRLMPEAAMKVVPIALEPAHIGLAFERAREERIVFFGSWIERKGITSFLKVVVPLLRERPALILDLYGTDPLTSDPLRDFPEEIRPRVVVHPRLPLEEVIAGLARAKVFFLPAEYEGFGLALAEAMACGCAAVTTPTGFGDDLISGEEAIVCPFGDAVAMGVAVRRLLDDEALRTRVAEAGWRRVQVLQWKTSVRRLEAIYQQWLAERLGKVGQRSTPAATALA